MNPIVSIVMPAYNRAKYIGKAIESVQAQTLTQWELIIVDDASIDATAAIAQSYADKDNRIRLIRNEHNSGISVTRNRGVGAGKAQYIAMLDSDDVWLDPIKLQKQIDFLNSHADQKYGLVGTGIVVIDDQDKEGQKIVYAGEDDRIRRRILSRNPIVQSSVVFTRQAYDTAGGYDPRCVVAEDLDLWLRIGLTHKFAVLPIHATGYRVHGGSISKQKKMRMAMTCLKLVAKYGHKYPNALMGWIIGLGRLVKAAIV